MSKDEEHQINLKELEERVKRATRLLKDTKPFQAKVTGRLVRLPASGEGVIIGDLHGDYRSLRHILEESEFREKAARGERIYLICLGDYVDRGGRQIEVIDTLLSLMENYPRKVILLRGNHEGPRDIIPVPHDLPRILFEEYGEPGKGLYGSLQMLFDQLYTATIIEGRAFLVHGGIPTQTTSLEEISYAHLYHPEKSHLSEMLWNDPSPQPGTSSSYRGIGKLFGPDVTKRFISELGVKILIRGHTPHNEGYHFQDRSILTLFSCKLPVYGNRYGAYLHLSLDENFKAQNLRDHLYTF